MDGWTCPTCGRLFGRSRQSHECEPGPSIEEYFSTGPAHERPVFEAIAAHLATVGPVHADVVSVGIFLKNPRTFAQLRPMTRWVAVAFLLSRRARHRAIVRKVTEYGAGRYWHVANVRSPEDFDDALRDLLTEAYRFALFGQDDHPGARQEPITRARQRTGARARSTHRAPDRFDTRWPR